MFKFLTIAVLVVSWLIVTEKLDFINQPDPDLIEFKKSVATGEQKSKFIGIVKSSSAINYHTVSGGFTGGLALEMDSGDFVGLKTNMISMVQPGVEVRSATYKGESFYCLTGSITDCFPSLDIVTFGV